MQVERLNIMSRVYIVQPGDGLFLISTKFYGTAKYADQIVSANPQLSTRKLGPDLYPTIWPNDRLIIPDLQNKQLLTNKDPERVDAAGQSDISILIDGDNFSLWETASIVRSFDTIADTFNLTSPFDFKNELQQEIFKPFAYKPFSLYIGGERMMSGTIIDVNPETSANKSKVSLSGYSLPGILADVNLSPSMYPFESDGLNLKQIAEKLSAPFGITVVFSNDPGSAFSENDKTDIGQDEKIYNYLVNLARQRGFVISSNIQGNLVFQKTTTAPPTETIIGGQPPFAKSGARYKGQVRSSSITALSIEAVSGAGQSATIEDPEIVISRPRVIKAQDTNSGNLKGAAIAQYGRDLAASAIISLTVLGWRRPSDKQLWQENTKIVYLNPGDMIYKETEFLIKKVNYIKTPNNEITVLTLVFPEAYSGKIREGFPWD
jgi:prophage tail gpP-like protein